MTTQEVKQLCKQHNKTWEDFIDWHTGQTVGMDDCEDCEDGKDELTAWHDCTICNGKGLIPNYYKRDVARFLEVNENEL